MHILSYLIFKKESILNLLIVFSLGYSVGSKTREYERQEE